MKWHRVPLEDVAPQPWRNGGGITRELLAWPSVAGWRVRISMADVESSGPFSRFDGIERWFAVLSGEGVVLDVDGAQHRVTAGGEPLRFDGGATTGCTLLGGATCDLNLMAAPGTARMQRIRGTQAMRVQAPALLALYAHAAPARAEVAGESVALPPLHLAWCLVDAPEEARVAGQDAFWMEVAI